MTAGALLITAVVRGAWMVLASWANSGCFFLMCWTILVWDTRTQKVSWGLGLSKTLHSIVNYCKKAIVNLCINVYTDFQRGKTPSLTELHTNLAAVLFGTVWAADWCSGDGASQLGVCAQHGVRLPRCSRSQLTDAGRQFCPGVVLQYVGFPLTGTFIHLHTDKSIISIH